MTFEQAAKQYRRRVYAQAYRLTGNYAEAEDLTQDTLTRAFQKWDQFSENYEPLGWFLRMCTNLFIDSKRVLRATRTEQLGPESEAWYKAVDPMDFPRYLDAERIYTHLMPHERELVQLYAQGYEQTEMAAMLGLPKTTVKTRIFRMQEISRELATA